MVAASSIEVGFIISLSAYNDLPYGGNLGQNGLVREAIKFFQGKSVVLTGASGGIGASLARQIVNAGAGQVFLIDKDSDGLAKLKASIRQASSTSTLLKIISLDLRSQNLDAVLKREIGNGSVDVLINNAGIIRAGYFETMPVAEFTEIFETNLSAVIALTRFMLPRMIHDGRSVIVNIASGLGLVGQGGLTAYCASKFGLVGFGEALGCELSGKVRVITVCPAFVNTPIMGSRLGNNKDAVLRLFGESPDVFAGRVCRAIAKANRGVLMDWKVRFLAVMQYVFPGVFRLLRRYIYGWMLKNRLV